MAESWKPGHFIKKAGDILNTKNDGNNIETETAVVPASASVTSEPPLPQPETTVSPPAAAEVVPRDSPSLAMKPFFASESEPFYLNIVVVDSGQAVKEKLDAKLGKGFWSNQASKLAKQVVSESKVASKVAEQLSEKIPLALAEMGITLELTTKFKIGSFVVLKARIIDLTPLQLVKFAKGEAYAASFSAMLDSFEELELTDAINTVSVKVQEKVTLALIDKLAEVLPQKLEEQGILITAVAKSSHDQSEFFFDFVQGIMC